MLAAAVVTAACDTRASSVPRASDEKVAPRPDTARPVATAAAPDSGVRLQAGADSAPATTSAAPAQERRFGPPPREPRLDVMVHVANVGLSGDTIAIGYVIESRPGTPMTISSLALRTPTPAIALEYPKDRHSWDTFERHGDEPMPTWAAMGAGIRAGESSPVLTMRAVGVTGLIGYYAVPDIMERMKRDTVIDDTDTGTDGYEDWGFKGEIVGIVPPPANLGPAGQVARIQGFLARSCGAERWITSDVVCTSLAEQLQRAAQAFAGGNAADARPHLTAFLAELDAQRGAAPSRHVTEAAYALLRPNVAYLLR